MKLTDQEKEMFRTLKSGQTGKTLKEYLRRLQAEICDVRNIPDGIPPSAVKYLSNTLERELINKLFPDAPGKENKSEYE